MHAIHSPRCYHYLLPPKDFIHHEYMLHSTKCIKSELHIARKYRLRYFLVMSFSPKLSWIQVIAYVRSKVKSGMLQDLFKVKRGILQDLLLMQSIELLSLNLQNFIKYR